MENLCGKITVNAKVNLSLYITGVRGSLHILEMETMAIDLCDTATYVATESGGVSVDFPIAFRGFKKTRFMPVVDRAISKFVARYGEVNAHVKIEKNVPLGAGLGGSSTAIAALLLALAKIKNIQLDTRFLLSVGSDLPVVVKGGHNLVTGVGEEVEKLPYKEKFFVILARGEVDSGKAYSLYEEIGTCLFGGKNSVEHPRVNHLEYAARQINHHVISARNILHNCGSEDVVMTGSGSGMIGVFDSLDQAKAVFEKVQKRSKRYFVCLAKSV